ncbi:MAG: hypothetical protein D6677_08685 [Calditrichaeota bacterium]|nr:MAG: hypothetical protein D6677_08685 [Calditrichota bacterium]
MSERNDPELTAVRRFGYLLSFILIIIANIGLINEWAATPILFLITMYFLTGSMWASALIRPFYRWIGQHIIKPDPPPKPPVENPFSDN